MSISGDLLRTYTVYDHPVDYPNGDYPNGYAMTEWGADQGGPQ